MFSCLNIQNFNQKQGAQGCVFWLCLEQLNELQDDSVISSPVIQSLGFQNHVIA